MAEAVWRINSRVVSATEKLGSLFKTLDTVALETPQLEAISERVAIDFTSFSKNIKFTIT